MAVGLLILVLVVIAAVVFHGNTTRFIYEQMVRRQTLYLHDNSDVPALSPPDEIIIHENELQCHKIPLTPCTSNRDCQLCREARAMCQQFHERVVLELDDDTSVTIQPGESYCLALSNNQARFCNPNTGTWIMRQIDSNNYSLICHCDYPGLVTQTTVYDDCDVPVGCKPNGVISDINVQPMRCDCDAGFVSEISETGTPYCRPRVFRDVMLDPQFLHRPPCRFGFISTDHPGIDQTFQRQIGSVVCIPDPCSIDPVTGARTNGRLIYADVGPNGKMLSMCSCDHSSFLFPVYSPVSMLNQGDQPWQLPNYCIAPFTDFSSNIHIDLKWFWARNDYTADADIVAQVDESVVSPRYIPVMQRRTTDRPHSMGHEAYGPVNQRDYLLKFSICSLWLPTVDNARQDYYQRLWSFESNVQFLNQTCMATGYGSCNFIIVANPSVCLLDRRLYGEESCIQNRKVMEYDNEIERFATSSSRCCVFWHVTKYPPERVPVAWYINLRFVTVNFANTEVYYDINTRLVRGVNLEDTLPRSMWPTAVTLLSTYPNYGRDF